VEETAGRHGVFDKRLRLSTGVEFVIGAVLATLCLVDGRARATSPTIVSEI